MEILITLIFYVSDVQCLGKYFGTALGPCLYADHKVWTFGDDLPAKTELGCAFLCLQKDGCGSFLYKETDKPQENCYKTTAHEYTGTLDVIFNGFICNKNWADEHRWSNDITNSSFPDGSMAAAKHYCRDPLKEGYLWCIIDQDVSPNSNDWGTCNIPKCMTDKCRLYTKVFKDNRVLTREGMIFYYDLNA